MCFDHQADIEWSGKSTQSILQRPGNIHIQVMTKVATEKISTYKSDLLHPNAPL
jgi:hypothetical protein